MYVFHININSILIYVLTDLEVVKMSDKFVNMNNNNFYIYTCTPTFE